MSDRELLELAAKAAGIHLDNGIGNGGTGGKFDLAGNAMTDWHNNVKWNPLTDDGDALRLAVKLRLEIDIDYYAGILVRTSDGIKVVVDTIKESNYHKATRLAIVRAAAEIGKMK